MRIKFRVRLALCIGVLALAPIDASAWSNQGHMVTGAIAYDDLKSNPALVTKIEALMASHPDKARFDRALAGFTGEARTRRLFELMARWPDDARLGPYDHPGWHYWLRLIPSKSDPLALPAASRSMLTMTTGEADVAYRLNLATVRDLYAPAADRAVSLCWLFHLAGDIQQPLHAGHLISGRFALSDRAGVAAFVTPSGGGKATSLHAYWDDVIGGDGDDDANVETVRLRLEKSWPRSALKELSGKADPEAFRVWADESLVLARSAAYRNGTFEGATTPSGAQRVTPDYEASRRMTGERRVVLGGYRIANAVRSVF